jgi:hypothetical protein
MIRYLIALLFLSFSAVSEIIDTGNILSNSTFGSSTTYDTTGWTISSGTSGHDNMNTAGGNDPGGSVASTGNTNIEQTVTLSDKTNMTVEEIQNGWSSTMSTDVWFWNQYSNTTTLKQTITGSDGSTSTQQRIIEDTGCGSINCGSYTNYTDTHIQGSNTQTDFDIKVGVSNSNNRSGHYGPDIDDVQLKIQYTYINPLEEDTQEIIDDINEDISDTIDDIVFEEEEYTWDDSWQDDYSWEEEYTWEEDFYFEEEYDTSWDDEVSFEEFEIEEFEEISFEEPIFFEEFETFEEMPNMNEVFFEEEFTETSIMEEIFEEEFEEDFTTFLEDTGMEEEFAQFLEDEGMTQEEFFEEITEEEFNDEFTGESFEEFEEEFDETATIEESPSEIIETEEETMELESESELLEEEQEVAQNESTEESESQEELQEEESDSEGTEDSEVQTADSEEQDSIQSEGRDEVDTNDRIATDVARIETKVKRDLKKIAKEIAKATKINTQNLSKEDIFFKNNNTLNAYLKTNFYKSKDIYTDSNLDLFNQIDLGVYTKDIYTTVTLASYVNNDPVEVHNKKLREINIEKRKLQAELEALKNK